MKYIALLLLLVACAPVSVVNSSSPTISVPIQEINTSVSNVSEHSAYEVAIESTPVVACALLSSDEGNSLCGTEAQRSEMVGFNCRQVFRNNESPFYYTVIELMNYSTVADAQKKFTFDRKSTASVLVNDSFEFVDSHDTRTVEFINGYYVNRVFEVKKGACKDFEGLVSLVKSRMK